LKTQKSVSDLLFPNQYRRKVLGLLLMKPGQWIHLRELARMTGAVPGTLKKEVDALCDVGLLQSRRIGNQTQFSANTAHPVYPELQALVKKTIGLAAAQSRLHDAQRTENSAETRFDCAYTAIRAIADAALLKRGHHQTTIQCLDGLRKQRNLSDYDGELATDQALVECIQQAIRLPQRATAGL